MNAFIIHEVTDALGNKFIEILMQLESHRDS